MTNVVTYASNDAATTEAFGRRLGRALPERAVILLEGPLGSGKTTLVAGLVSVRTNDPVSSPTFVYHQRYGTEDRARRTDHRVNLPTSDLRPLSSGVVDHFDLYRVESAVQRARIDLEMYLADPPGWIVVEWPKDLPTIAADVPVVHIHCAGPPTFTFEVISSNPMILEAMRQAV